jgi:hypothetical protein
MFPLPSGGRTSPRAPVDGSGARAGRQAGVRRRCRERGARQRLLRRRQGGGREAAAATTSRGGKRLLLARRLVAALVEHKQDGAAALVLMHQRGVLRPRGLAFRV